MSVNPEQSTLHSLTVTLEEIALLTNLLSRSLGETRVEVHRTHTPDFRDQVQHEEAVIRGLLDKLHALRGET